MSRNQRFEQLLAQLTQRESSTLTIVTVASSASLVLLGVALTMATSPPNWLGGAGYFFPLAGLSYRELTIFTVDRRNLNEIRWITGYDMKASQQPARHLRRFMVLAIVVLPSFLWVLHFSSYVSREWQALFSWGEGLALLALSLELVFLEKFVETQDKRECQDDLMRGYRKMP